jgi:hypothetical protein
VSSIGAYHERMIEGRQSRCSHDIRSRQAVIIIQRDLKANTARLDTVANTMHTDHACE